VIGSARVRLRQVKTCSGGMMRISRVLVGILTIACAWPVVIHAAEISLPELGIHLMNLPDGVEKPEVKRRIDGYTATLHIGTATLEIDRLDDVVPSGSDIRNETFRASQEAGFPFPPPHVRGQATVIDGHNAWTSTSAVRSGAPGAQIAYTSITYALVDAHLYRFRAKGWGGDTPPPDFIAVVRAMSDLTFATVDSPAVAESESPSGLIKMPYFWPSSKDYYPAAAKRRGDTGIVNLEFSIDGKGHARDVRPIYAATELLGASARSLLTDVQFHLPPDWENKGYQKLRFTFEVHYALWESGHPCAQLPLRVPDAQLVVICGSR
jgi:hypothetical protein